MNLLLVDDQPNILSSLLSGIPWREMGFTSIFTATSAASARTILKNNEVDVVISDIEMPNEDGLSLLSWARAEKLDYECILLTAHADFFYAKQAIPLGVSEYIIQPARNEDIVRAVQNAIRKIKDRNSGASEKLEYNRLNFVAQNAALRAFFEYWPNPETLELNPEKLHEVLEKLEEKDRKIDPDKPVFSFYFQIRSWNTMPLSHQELVPRYLQLMRDDFPDHEEKMLFWNIDDNSFYTVFFETDVPREESNIERLYQDLPQKLGFTARLFYTESKLTHLRAALDFLKTEAQKFNLEKGPEALGLTRLRYDPLTASGGVQSAYEQYGRLIHEYIRLHISEPLTRTQIADELHLSPDHISFIIRSVDGMTCKELITKMKMEHARDLLRHSRKAIGEVAQECGYDSFAYFSKVYKDTYGTTPRQDRERKG